MISNVYSKSFVQSSEASKSQARVLLFDRLLPLLQHSASESQVPQGVDAYSIFLAVTMDFISAYIFGIQNSTNFIQNAAYREHWLKLYLSRHDYPFFPQELPGLTRFLRKLGFSPYPRWVDSANHELEGWNQRLCKAALESNVSTKDTAAGSENEAVVLKTLLAGLSKEAASSGKKSPLYPTAIRHHELSVACELFDHMLAGQETSGIALAYLTWQLSRDQELQRELQDELLTLEPSLKASGGKDRSIPNGKDIDALPTLHGIVMETLRLRTPIPGPLPRQTPYPSAQLGPFKVPGGVRVSALAYTLHRRESVFAEPAKFDHTRWLDEAVDEETRKERNKHFWAFSSGGRMCIGSNFAMHGNYLPLGVAPRMCFPTTMLIKNPRNETHCRRHLLEFHQPCCR